MRDNRPENQPYPFASGLRRSCFRDFSSDTYAYRFILTGADNIAQLTVDRTRPHPSEATRACEVDLSPPQAVALRAALAIYVECRGLPSEYKLRAGRGTFPILHPNGNVTFGEFTTPPSWRALTCKALSTYSADPTDSFGLFVDEPQCRECGGYGERVADLALDLADATALLDGLDLFIARLRPLAG